MRLCGRGNASEKSGLICTTNYNRLKLRWPSQSLAVIENLIRVAERFLRGIPHPHLLGVCRPNLSLKTPKKIWRKSERGHERHNAASGNAVCQPQWLNKSNCDCGSAAPGLTPSRSFPPRFCRRE